MRGWIRTVLAGSMAAALLAPVTANACTAPQFETFLFWPTAPADRTPDEIVVRVTSDPPVTGPRYIPQPIPLQSGQGALTTFGATLKTYRVEQVLAGAYAGRTVVVAVTETSCSRGSVRPADRIVVGRLAPGPGDTQMLIPREMRYGAPPHRMLLEADAKAGSTSAMLALGRIAGLTPEGLTWMNAAAEKGDADAMRTLGDIYGNSRGLFYNPELSLGWKVRWTATLSGKAEAGDIPSMMGIADSIHSPFNNKQGWAPRADEAVRWYRAAADLGDGRAMHQLGYMSQEGRGVAPNAVEAERWLKLALLRNGSLSQLSLGTWESGGLFASRKDQPNVLAHLPATIARARAGDVGAMNALAWTYMTESTTTAQAEAVKWLQSAIDRGDPDAMLTMAVLLQPGPNPLLRNLGRDAAQARTLRQRAVDILTRRANGGDTAAMVRLGRVFDEGVGAPASPREAMTWYRKAADKGDVAGMRGVASLYATGRGVAASGAEAVRWYRQAADKGDIEAMTSLAELCESGWIIPRNLQEGAAWRLRVRTVLQARADAGDTDAMNDLARIYQLGEGVPFSDAEVIRWRLAAIAKGDVMAMRALGDYYRFPKRGVPAQPAEARRYTQMAAEAGDVRSMRQLWLSPGGAITVNGQPLASANAVRPEEAKAWRERMAAAGYVF